MGVRIVIMLKLNIQYVLHTVYCCTQHPKFYYFMTLQKQFGDVLPNSDNVRSSNEMQIHQSEMVAQDWTLSVVQHSDASGNFIFLLNFVNDVNDDASNV